MRREVVKRAGSLDATTGLSPERLVLSVRNTHYFLADVNLNRTHGQCLVRVLC
jgi:hypothetical protein